MLTSMAFMIAAAISLKGVFMPQFTYDPKDVVILMGGFMFGPFAALMMSALVALLEMFTISVSGPYGALMNFLSSASFTCTAALVYSKKRDLLGAFIGLVTGVAVVIPVMCIANYFIIPLYTPASPEYVRSIMLSAIIPFNAMKAGLNAVLAVLIYKKVSSALSAAGLYKEFVMKDGNKSTANRFSVVIMVVSAVIAIALIVALFANLHVPPTE